MYLKDFDNWNRIKKKIDRNKNSPIFYEREVWHCKLGLNINSEQDGVGDNFTRPVLIFKKFNKQIFWAIPLTKTIKNLPFYYKFNMNKNISVAILSQIRLLDSKRLLVKIGNISNKDSHILNKKFKALLP